MNDALKQFFVDYSYFSSEDQVLINKAWEFMSEKKRNLCRTCGEDFMDHPLRVARTLAALKLDADSIICAFLHGSLEELELTAEEITSQFGEGVSNLVQGTARISGLNLKNKTVQQAETIRKMFFAMVDDIRIILIRLADRLDKMRSLKNFPPEMQKHIAQETIDIWAPLANRLGISFIKDELEDLSLKFLNREVFDQIKSLVSAKKVERSSFLKQAETEIVRVAKEAGIEISVHSRAKHFWSIYQKMKKRSKGVDELYDLLALRILCNSVTECYTLLGLVHTIWKPLDGRFKDYIAMPKSNGYQSLHTSVLCYEGKQLEIQIRTHEMHNIAENGVASHWLYKKGSSRKVVSAETLSVINQLRELSKNPFSDEDLLARIKSDILGDSIFVFTPKGDIKELPAGSTPIDFAYHIHSAVGEKIVGAKADGSIIPLSYSLKNTQVVEIMTHPQAHPTWNQYNNVRTAKARQKIRAWLQANTTFSETEKLEKTEAKPGLRHAHHKGSAETKQEQKREFDTAVLRIRIGDSTNFMIKFAQCCRPVPPVPITGYVSRGRGIIIHRKDCTNLARIPEIENRNIGVEWENDSSKEKPSTKKKKGGSSS
ncbi:MAG TPA: bifunctional (p)ppGpp synthetase/guanosine-3',5'-bis(diphosphate) 3'-pyrophosphohydrolase [Treponema sp.]|nr:bifunctional (p)ppGpp synthetase/guanosine-3',5'-bis(diphosphate) 3'-pyrophosphohydrolase [Treponema sp.]